MSLFHKDIVPRLLQAEAQFSTLNLTGRIPGPRYEDFDAVMARANKWLETNANAHLVSCEVVEVDGTYLPPTAADLEAQLVSVYPSAGAGTDQKDGLGQGVAAFLRVLRMWYTQEVHNPYQPPAHQRELAYENVLPCRLESTPRAFGPKFQNLNETMNHLNEQLLENEHYVDGDILSIQTCVVRFSSQHCSIDPDRMFWMAENREDVHVCYYFRIYFIRDRGRDNPVHRIGQIGYKDFPPSYQWRGKKKREVQSEMYPDLVHNANDWLEKSHDAHVINVQTLDHHAYFRCARDSPGQECHVLDNPHFRSSLAGLMHFTKVLRLFYYTREDDASLQPPPIYSKVFHVEQSASCDQVRLGSCHNFTQLPLAAHREVLTRVNEWLAHNGVRLLSVETVKVTTSPTKSTYSINETHFQSCGQGSVYTLYAMRLYVTSAKGSDSGHLRLSNIDFSPEPKTIRINDSNCQIL